MVDELLSDEEREEALREWWRENWRWIIGGVILGVLGLVGWHYRGVYHRENAQEASALYRELESAVTANDADKVKAAFDKLVGEYDATPYAQQARLLQAKSDVEAGKYDEAAAQLRAVVDGSRDKELAAIATLRLARLQVQQGKHDDAFKLVEPLNSGAFGAQAREIRGDALLAKGDTEGARAEYAAALSSVEAQIDRTLVELKLQDVGGTAPAVAAQGQP